MNFFEGTVFPIGFVDIEIALKVVKEYSRMYPEDEYVPEIEKGSPENGFSVVINVPRDKYVNFDFAVMVVTGD
ncbi:hypothetical protein A2337_01010 [candidate division WWE3 bacterium RIFOXYB2_FULL_43_9]|nr:MAG: hypothetical protein A2337_01010 [candidate division WWE3 bacterium RIFOXYB2_FULL_43_9]